MLAENVDSALAKIQEKDFNREKWLLRLCGCRRFFSRPCWHRTKSGASNVGKRSGDHLVRMTEREWNVSGGDRHKIGPIPFEGGTAVKWTIRIEVTQDGKGSTTRDIGTITRPIADLLPEQIGLTLEEGQQLLRRIQMAIIGHQVHAARDERLLGTSTLAGAFPFFD